MFMSDGKNVLKLHYRSLDEVGSTICKTYVLARRVKRYAFLKGMQCDIRTEGSGKYEVIDITNYSHESFLDRVINFLRY